MKTWKLVSGILCVVLCLFVLLQSCAAGAVNAIEDNGQASGSAGFIVAIMMLAGGITSISTRNSIAKGGDIALIVLFGIATVVGFALAGNYTDLYIWAGWCLVNVILAFVSLRSKNNPKQA